MYDFRNELEIQFIGLQRSGNHAVLSWLFRQFEQPVYFFNNAKHFGNPIEEFQPLDLPNTVTIRRGRSVGRKRQLLEIGRRKKHVLAYSYENLPLRELRRKQLVPNKDAVTGTSRRLVRLLIIRDFPNWLASRVRYHETLRGKLPSRLQIEGFARSWAMYAKECAGETTYTRDVTLLTISFNRWVVEDTYRRGLLTAIGVDLRDDSVSYVPAAGGGSSFDATRLSGKAEQMRVFERWRYLEEDIRSEAIQGLRRRFPDIERLNNRIFPAGFVCYRS